MKKKCYLVTGGAGFIGSNITKRLISNGHLVYVIDNLATGLKSNLPPEANFVNTPIKDICSYKKKFDGIFHVGAPSSTPMYRANRFLVCDAMSDFVYIMEYAKENKIKVVYASSSSVYNGYPVPWKEKLNLIPTDFYTEVRVMWERIAKVYADQYRVDSVGLRLFSVYGKGEEGKHQYANLITQLIEAKRKGEVFEVYGNGEQKRDATFISDVVDAFILAMDSDFRYEILNIGTGVNYTLNEIIKMIGTQVKYVPVPFSNYVEVTLADTVRAERVLGFKAKINLEEGLRQLGIDANPFS